MAFKMNKPSPFKKGLCGTPGYPPCEKELRRMAKAKGYPDSYIDSIKLKDAGNLKMVKRFNKKIGGPEDIAFLSPRGLDEAVRAETNRRIDDLISDPGYIALTQNSAARPIVNRITNYIKNARKQQGRRTSDYIVPSREEAKNLLSIGRKYVNSKNIMEDIDLIDGAKAYFYGKRLLSKYPNLQKIANKYQ